MKRNIGKTDMIIRLIGGIIIIIVGIAAGSWWGVIGLIPIITAFMKRCLPYSILGISTYKAKETTTEDKSTDEQIESKPEQPGSDGGQTEQ